MALLNKKKHSFDGRICSVLDVLDPIVIALQQCQKNSMYSSSSLGYFQNLTTKGTQFKECDNELFSRYL